MQTEIEQAAQEFVDRRDRKTNPEGTFDKRGRFYLSDDEHQGCCNSIHRPSAVYPYSLMVHARTAIHVANMYGVDPKDVRKQAKAL